MSSMESKLPSITEALLLWVNQYQGFQQVNSLEQVADCQFFAVLLNTLPGFKLVETFVHKRTDESAKIRNLYRIKDIIHSLQIYQKENNNYFTFNIDCWEIAIGSKNQIIKFILILLRILCGQQRSNWALQAKLRELSFKYKEIIMKAVTSQNQSFEQSGFNSNRSWGNSSKKKMILGMEKLQNRVYQLEQLIRYLEQQLFNSNESLDFYRKQNQTLKQDIKKVSKLNQQIKNNDQMEINQLKQILICQKEKRKNIEKQKQSLEFSLSKCQFQANQSMVFEMQNKKLKQNLNEVTQINKQNINYTNNLLNTVEQLQRQLIEINSKLDRRTKQLNSLQQKYTNLQDEYYMHKNKMGRSVTSSSFYGVAEANQINQNQYRIKQTLTKNLGQIRSCQQELSERNDYLSPSKSIKSIIAKSKSKRQVGCETEQKFFFLPSICENCRYIKGMGSMTQTLQIDEQIQKLSASLQNLLNIKYQNSKNSNNQKFSNFIKQKQENLKNPSSKVNDKQNIQINGQNIFKNEKIKIQQNDQFNQKQKHQLQNHKYNISDAKQKPNLQAPEEEYNSQGYKQPDYKQNIMQTQLQVLLNVIIELQDNIQSLKAQNNNNFKQGRKSQKRMDQFKKKVQFTMNSDISALAKSSSVRI